MAAGHGPRTSEKKLAKERERRAMSTVNLKCDDCGASSQQTF